MSLTYGVFAVQLAHGAPQAGGRTATRGQWGRGRYPAIWYRGQLFVWRLGEAPQLRAEGTPHPPRMVSPHNAPWVSRMSAWISSTWHEDRWGSLGDLSHLSWDLHHPPANVETYVLRLGQVWASWTIIVYLSRVFFGRRMNRKMGKYLRKRVLIQLGIECVRGPL